MLAGRLSTIAKYILVLLLVFGTAGCSRSRPWSRSRGTRAPSPSPPPVRIEESALPEVPLHLEPAGATAATRGSRYGPPPVSVAPLGSTGFSRDIRYPPPRRQLSSPGSAVSANGNGAPRSSARISNGADSSELPLTVPKSRNGTTTRPPRPDRQPSSAESTPPGAERITGIPQYMVLEPNVATGGKPTLDGMKWLKERGFQTVLDLLPADQADVAEPSMIEELGLEYVSLPITPATIDRATVERFNELVDDSKHRPLFIHDSTGTATAAMWYLHRVTVDRVPEDQARNQAARIGLKASDTEFWIAIERYLAEIRNQRSGF